MHGHMEAVAEVAEGTLADTAVTLAAAGGTRAVIIILVALVITVVAIMAMAHVLSVAGVADGVTAIPVAIGGDLGSMVIRIGGGPICMPIHIPMSILIMSILITYLHRGALSSLPRIANRNNSNPTTGIIVRIRKATTRTSKTVRAVG